MLAPAIINYMNTNIAGEFCQSVGCFWPNKNCTLSVFIDSSQSAQFYLSVGALLMTVCCVCLCSQNKGRRTYFYTGFVAYFLGLMTTIGIMHVFKHAQVNVSVSFSGDFTVCRYLSAVKSAEVEMCVELASQNGILSITSWTLS